MHAFAGQVHSGVEAAEAIPKFASELDEFQGLDVRPDATLRPERAKGGQAYVECAR